MSVKTIEWSDGKVIMIDQRLLPHEERYVECNTPDEVAEAIRNMTIRGAPAIGISAAYGLAQAVIQGPENEARARGNFENVCRVMAGTRPTAVNLFWAIDKMKIAFEAALPGGVGAVRTALLQTAKGIHNDDVEACRRMGRFGAMFVPDNATILTHCNAGALATGGYGTALGVIRAAVEAGKKVRVLADETRPWLQGARLTSYELAADGIDVTLICDNMAGHFMSRGKVDLVVVGADRIAANGDFANKIGTYSVAVLAKENKVPFYVAAPLSTIDRNLRDGTGIVIEERSPDEVTVLAGKCPIAPAGMRAYNPAFDVTPARYVTAIFTEAGVAIPPSVETVSGLFTKSDQE
jgi:methylthioribose-1-phosphate isomerase